MIQRDENVIVAIELLNEQAAYGRSWKERVTEAIDGGQYPECDSILRLISCSLHQGIEKIEAAKDAARTDVVTVMCDMPLLLIPCRTAQRAFEEVEKLYAEEK